MCSLSVGPPGPHHCARRRRRIVASTSSRSLPTRSKPCLARAGVLRRPRPRVLVHQQSPRMSSPPFSPRIQALLWTSTSPGSSIFRKPAGSAAPSFISGELIGTSDEYADWVRELTKNCPFYSRLKDLDPAVISNDRFPYVTQLSSGAGPAFTGDNIPWFQWLNSMTEFSPIPLPQATIDFLRTLSAFWSDYYKDWSVDSSPEAFLPQKSATASVSPQVPSDAADTSVNVLQRRGPASPSPSPSRRRNMSPTRTLTASPSARMSRTSSSKAPTKTRTASRSVREAQQKRPSVSASRTAAPSPRRSSPGAL